VDAAEDIENFTANKFLKRKKQPVLAGVDTGTLLYSAVGQRDPTMDMFSTLLVEIQRSEVAAQEHHEKTCS
jgi:hypothetical protein